MLEKLNEDLHQPSGIRHASYHLVLDGYISLAYWNRLISGVIQFVVVHPKPYKFSLRNKIGDSAGEVPCFFFGDWVHNVLELLSII